MSSDPRLPLEALIEALSEPGVLPGSDDRGATVIQTHISVVFLVGERAYKLKKPVYFGFLDFSSADKRAHFAREELRLNRRLAPSIYEGLCPLRVDDEGGVSVGEPSEAPAPSDELLVAMVRLPQERMMDALLARGEVDERQVERLARLVAAFHRGAETGAQIERFGTREAAGRLALENFDQTTDFCGALFDAAAHARMRARNEAFLETRERLFARRVEAGRVRDVHGDLHSPNICLVGDDPIVYDCIEFSSEYRCMDVASEVAFTAMDLEFRGRRDLAERFVELYQDESDDRTLTDMLPFYRAYRAMVRAKIAALTSAAPEVDATTRERSQADARKLFALAEQYSEGLIPPALVVFAGATGAGKREAAAAFGALTGVTGFHAAAVRKSLFGETEDDDLYSEGMTAATYRALLRESRGPLSEGAGALSVGHFFSREQRDACRELAQAQRVPRLHVHFESDDTRTRERLAARGEELSESYRALLEAAEPCEEVPEDELLVIDSATDPEDAALLVARRLRREV